MKADNPLGASLRVWRFVPILAGLTGMVSAAEAVEVQVPAKVSPRPVPTAHCRFLMPTDGGRYALYRSLDGRDRRLEQSAQWVDTFSADPQAPVTLSIEWRSRDFMFDLPAGMTNFYLRGQQTNVDPLRLRFVRPDGTLALAVEAGPGFRDTRHATAYVRVGELLRAFGDAPEMRLELEQGEPPQGKITFSTRWSTRAFREAVASYPIGVRWLERAEASPRVFCTAT